MNKRAKQLVIKKQATSSNYTTETTTYDSEYDSSSENDSYTTDSNIRKIKMKSKKPKSISKNKIFTSIVNSEYKRPKEGTKQDNYTKENIIKELNGYIPLRTLNEKKILTELPIFKTWIKYITLDTKQFRKGGLLMKVQYPDYITLVNTRTKLTWSVQLNNAIIYIRDPRNQDTTYDETTEYDTNTYYTDTYTDTPNEIDIIKEKLYKLYLKGQLTTKK